MKEFIKWTKKEYSLPVRLLVTLCAGAIFAFLIPLTLINYLPELDSTIGLPRLYFGIVNWIIGGLCVVVGVYYGFMSIGSQLFDAGGTPIPVVATQKLLVSGVFRQCRNPMGFGAISAYLGVAILVGSISSIACVILFAVLLIIYIKKFEERELEERFGDEYRAYKASTPFLIPRIFRQ